MAQIIAPGQPGSLPHIDITQGAYRDQISMVTQLCRQIGGNADLATEVLTSKYSLYVNPETGRDDFAKGDASFTTGLTKQQATCGYSAFAPFKTLQRAFLEAARISVIAGGINDLYDRVVIYASAGEHIIDNTPGGGTVNAWANEYEPTEADLRAFNTPGRVGTILPRGVSVIGGDLRKSVIRPGMVPPPSGDPSTGRGSIFRTTGGGFFFNFTFKDNPSYQQSHHLLECFSLCSEADLKAYYDKVASAFGLNIQDIEIRPGETQIVAPYPDGAPVKETDTTRGSSCYVFNCSLRSDYGMCGIFLDGNEATGFKSMVTAQFTNVSLQRDMNAWQLHNNVSGDWVTPSDYQQYINHDINNIRYRISGNYNARTGCYAVDWRNFGFKVIDNAIIQEVSCFVIGDAVHHWTASGGECTITNSNSNFGCTSLLSSGFRGIGTNDGAFPQDKDFSMLYLRRPLKMKQDGTNVRQVSLGLVKSYNKITGVLTLDRALDPETQLKIFGYSLAPNTYIWVENRSRDTGPGYIPGDKTNSAAINVRALMDNGAPWDPVRPDQIQLNPSTDLGVNNLSTMDASIVGNRVFLRRLVDNRTVEQREYSLLLKNSRSFGFRRPLGNYVLRLGGRSQLSEQLDPTLGADQLFLVSDATPAAPWQVSDNPAVSYTDMFRVTLRPGDQQTSFAPGAYYRVGNAVMESGRVKRSRRNGFAPQFTGDDWEPSMSMLVDARGIEQSRVTQAPVLVVDRDSDPDPGSFTLGVNLDSDTDVLGQIRSAADFRAMSGLMKALGYDSNLISGAGGGLAGAVLQPQLTNATRNWDPMASSSPIPSGKLTDRRQWPIEFNRPSLIRAFGQAYEWAGYANYTKAMPKYQVSVLSDQLKIDFFGASHLGGRVYNTGFNEDGLIVQGDTIKDLSTGRTSNTDVAGVGGLSGDPEFENIPTTFEDLTVTDEFNSLGRANFNNVVLNGFIDGSPTWGFGTLPNASRTDEGILRLATPQQVLEGLDDVTAITPLGFSGAANLAGGWLQLDANIKIDPRFLPSVTGLVGLASTTDPGIIEIADQSEAAAGIINNRAVTPYLLAYLRARASWFASLTALGKVPTGQLDAATETLPGIMELASDLEAIAYALRTVAISPANIGYLRDRPGGLAGLDNNGKLNPSVVPGGGTKGLPIRPIPWVVGADNFSTTMNFTWSHTTGGILNLGAPLTTGYEGASGFIYITNTSSTPVTGVNNSIWKPVVSAFLDPVTRTNGLIGNLLFTYYIRSATAVDVDVAQVS